MGMTVNPPLQKLRHKMINDLIRLSRAGFLGFLLCRVAVSYGVFGVWGTLAVVCLGVIIVECLNIAIREIN